MSYILTQKLEGPSEYAGGAEYSMLWMLCRKSVRMESILWDVDGKKFAQSEIELVLKVFVAIVASYRQKSGWRTVLRRPFISRVPTHILIGIEIC